MKEKRPNIRQLLYVFTVAFMGAMVGVALAIYIAVQTGNDNREATCSVIKAQQKVFDETPPGTEAGRNAQQAWDHLARSLGCD